MHSPREWITGALLLSLLFPTPARADVLEVSSQSPYTKIQHAVNAAANGDTILVHGGLYVAPVVISKGVSVVAVAGETVEIRGFVVVKDLTDQEAVLLDGLSLQTVDDDDGNVRPALTLSSCVGAIRVQGCDITGHPLGLPLHANVAVVVQDCQDVAMVSTQLEGGSYGTGSEELDGLVATNSSLTLHDCSLLGGEGDWGYGADVGGVAARLTNTAVYAANCTFLGGQGGQGHSEEFPGQGVSAGAPGGTGVVLDAGSSKVRFRACVVTGGEGGAYGLDYWGQGGTPAAPGADLEILSGAITTLSGDSLAFQMATPVHELEVSTALLSGAPGQPSGLLWGFLGGHHDLGNKGQLLLSAASPIEIIVVGPLDANGTAELPIPFDALLPGWDAFPITMQAVGLSGGKLVLGAPLTVVILDEAF
jgi:hypothetical protein